MNSTTGRAPVVLAMPRSGASTGSCSSRGSLRAEVVKGTSFPGDRRRRAPALSLHMVVRIRCLRGLTRAHSLVGGPEVITLGSLAPPVGVNAEALASLDRSLLAGPAPTNGAAFACVNRRCSRCCTDTLILVGPKTW